VNESNKTLTAKSTDQSSPSSNAVEEQEKIQKNGEKELDTIQFERSCILYQLEGASNKSYGVNIVLKIFFDAEMLCYRIIAQDDNQQCLCNTIITIETELKVNCSFLANLY